jgi:hypothetical protein
MKAFFTNGKLRLFSLLAVFALSFVLLSSSHREAPLIAYDPLADNTDVYAFRDPINKDKVTIIANYIPMQLPQAGPNYYSFGENIRYEIHIKNNLETTGDDITYRFTFKKFNEDPTTFFRIRLGKENQKNTYTLERRDKAGGAFKTIIENGVVPAYNVGPRSIRGAVGGAAGLNQADYNTIMNRAVTKASTGESVFTGTVDDPFFVDVGGIFDLGDAPRTTGTRPRDGLACLNVSTIAIQVDISTLQKDGKSVYQAKNILDPDYVIGVWASASRRKIRVLNNDGRGGEGHSGDWVQVSRLGMPLTNEAVIPIGFKDYWNSLTPYQDLSKINEFGKFFYNPELALYMDDAQFGKVGPALKPLRIQKKSLGQFGFGNGQNGLYGLKGNAALKGTALDDAIFGKLLLPAPNSPRSVDLWPIFHTGVPNLMPYQLATGKEGNPLAAGKPFINNFLPTGGDMLRLNMAVPVTDRKSEDFSNLGLIQAAVLGLTDSRFNKDKRLQFIPNMDGFPNGRRLEDDVTRIELQAVSGVVLAAIGLWYDDYNPKAGTSPVTPDLVSVLSYSTGVDKNDTTLRTYFGQPRFPYQQTPWPGTHNCDCDQDQSMAKTSVNSYIEKSELGVAAPEVIATATPNPVSSVNTLRYKLDSDANVQITVNDALGKPIRVLANKRQEAGTYTLNWQSQQLTKGTYFITIAKNGEIKQTIRIIKE